MISTVNATIMNIGPFEILATIGGGASGIVYKARNQTLGRIVAVKQLHKAAHEGDHLFNRFKREARIMASVRSPHVVTVYSFQMIDGKPLLEMECLEHGSLENLLTSAPVPFIRMLEVVEDILAGLQALHDAGVVHRDVKPGNVLEDEGGHYKLTDFGISMVESGGKATLEAATIRYLAPESAAEPPIADARSDVYSVGMVAYELLLGHDGFREAFASLTPIAAFAPRWLQWLKDVTQTAPPLHNLRPDIPVPVSQFVARLMAKDRDLRYGSADAALQALRTLPYTRRVSGLTPARRSEAPVEPDPAERRRGQEAAWKLKVRIVRKSEADATLTFSQSPISIGSSPHCDIVLSNSYVSGEHARIFISRGTITYEDQSRNGSFVNGQPVKRAALGQSGEVNVPPFRLAFELQIQDRGPDTLHRGAREGAEANDGAPTAAGTTLNGSPPRARATPVLRLIKGPGALAGNSYPLSGHRMIIGRGARAEITIDSTTVSRRHIELVRQPDGAWLAIDLKSANGMAVNGRRVLQHLLAAGDVLAIGPEIELQFVVPEPGGSLEYG